MGVCHVTRASYPSTTALHWRTGSKFTCVCRHSMHLGSLQSCVHLRLYMVSCTAAEGPQLDSCDFHGALSVIYPAKEFVFSNTTEPEANRNDDPHLPRDTSGWVIVVMQALRARMLLPYYPVMCHSQARRQSPYTAVPDVALRYKMMNCFYVELLFLYIFC